MNCIPRLNICLSLLCMACCVACGAPASESQPPSDPLTYRMDYELRPDPSTGSVEVTLNVAQSSALLREVTMRPDSRVTDIRADGELVIGSQEVRWIPPRQGGSIRWQVAVGQRRNGNGYDAWLGESWGLFRAEDVIPRAATRTRKGAQSESWLALRLPRG